MRLRRWKPAQDVAGRGKPAQDATQEREASAGCGSGEGDRILRMKRGKLAQDAAQERVTASCGQGEGS